MKQKRIAVACVGDELSYDELTILRTMGANHVYLTVPNLIEYVRLHH